MEVAMNGVDRNRESYSRNLRSGLEGGRKKGGKNRLSKKDGDAINTQKG